MSAYVLFNLLNDLVFGGGGGRIRCEAVPSILSVFPNDFNKFSNTGTRMQDSIYHMTLKSILLATFAQKCHDFAIRKCDVFIDVKA